MSPTATVPGEYGLVSGSVEGSTLPLRGQHQLGTDFPFNPNLDPGTACSMKTAAWRLKARTLRCAPDKIKQPSPAADTLRTPMRRRV